MTNAPAETQITREQEQMLQTLLTVPHRDLGPMVDTLRRAMQSDPYTTSRFCAWLLTNPQATTIDDHRQAAAIALLTSPFSNYREAGRTGLLGNNVYQRTFPRKVDGLPPFQIFRVNRFLHGRYVIFLGDLEVDRVPAWDVKARYVEPPVPAQNEGEAKSAYHRRLRALKLEAVRRETKEQRRARAQYLHLKRLALRYSKVRAKDSGHWTFKAKTRTGQSLPVEVTVGHFRVEAVKDFHIPTRLLKNVMRDYLKALEAKPKWFDSVLALNPKALWEAYLSNYIPRDARAQALLNGQPVEDSTATAIKRIAAETDANVRAQMVIEYKIPYTVATSLLPNEPAAWVALINNMTPNQAVNAVRWVEESGILKDLPEVRAVFEQKVGAANKTASALMGRRSSQSQDEGVSAQIHKAAEKAVAQRRKTITKNIALVVDISGSMEVALQYAAEFAGYLSASIPADRLLVIAFNSAVRKLDARDHSLKGWREAFAELKASGSTNIQGAVSWLTNYGRRYNWTPDEIVFVTDGGEDPTSDAAGLTHREFPTVPVTIFGIGEWNEVMVNGRRNSRTWHGTFADSFKRRGHEMNVYLPTSPTDYNLFDQAATALGGASRLQEILDTPLPYRVQA